MNAHIVGGSNGRIYKAYSWQICCRRSVPTYCECGGLYLEQEDEHPVYIQLDEKEVTPVLFECVRCGKIRQLFVIIKELKEQKGGV